MQLLFADVWRLLSARNVPVNKTEQTSIIYPSSKKIDGKETVQSVATWLADGIVAFNSGDASKRSKAFAPVPSLIGTSRESVSYLEDVRLLARAMKDVGYTAPFVDVELGAFLNEIVPLGVARSVAVVAGGNSNEEAKVAALCDSLWLLASMEVCPPNASACLTYAWEAFKARPHKERNGRAGGSAPWEVEHAFILGCYPVCQMGQVEKVRPVLSDIDRRIKSAGPKNVPLIVKKDLRACQQASLLV